MLYSITVGNKPMLNRITILSSIASITIIIGILTLTGCNKQPIGRIQPSGKITSMSELELSFNDEHKPEKLIYPSQMAGTIYRILFDDHVYIVRSDMHRGGICHDPDCEKQDHIKEQPERLEKHE